MNMAPDRLLIPVPVTCRQLADLFGVPLLELLSALRAGGYPCREDQWLLDIGVALAAEHFGLRERIELQWETASARDEIWPQLSSMAHDSVQDHDAAICSDALINEAIARLCEFMQRPADEASMSDLRCRIVALEEYGLSDAAVNDAWSMLLVAALGPELQASFREKVNVEFATVESKVPNVEILDVDNPGSDSNEQSDLAALIRRTLENPDGMAG